MNVIHQDFGKYWAAYNGDSAQVLPGIPESSVDFSVYSPPFASLYTYSASEFDLGNSKDWDEFFAHYQFILEQTLRVTKPGRLTAVHTADVPAMQVRDGYIGMRDFPGDVIRCHESVCGCGKPESHEGKRCPMGWVFSGRAIVKKNPQAQAIRTHSKALLFVQLNKDSSWSRPAIFDQVLLFRKPGDNAVPIVPVKNGDITNDKWIDWADGVWLDVSESDTLQYTTARDAEDERHICPLQLGTIERCIKLWSNPGETVLTQFLGIGSEAYQAVRFNRRALGIELKESYYRIAVQNLKQIEIERDSQDLFAHAGVKV